MNTTRILAVCIGAIALLPQAASALTEQWRFAVTGEVQQIATDGKGGCAFIANETNNVGNLGWLDKKGRMIYALAGLQSSIPVFGNTVNSCTKKQLLFTALAGFPVMGQAKPNGKVLPVAAFGGFVLGGPFYPIALSTVSDKKGFFVVNTDTNTHVDSIVRYTYK